MGTTTSSTPAKAGQHKAAKKPTAPRRRARTITVHSDDLKRALKRVKPITSTRSVEALGGVLIGHKSGRSVTVDASNMTTHVRTTIGGQGTTGFQTLVSAQRLGEALNALGDGTLEVTTLLPNEPVTLKLGKRTMTLPQLRVEDFPPVEFKAGTVVLAADQAVITEAVKPAITFASNDETRPILTALMLDIGRNTVWATDSYTLGVFPAKFAGRKKRTVMIVADVVTKALAGGTDRVTFGLAKDDRHATLQTPDALYVTRMIDGTPPDYAALIPEKSKVTTEVSVVQTDLLVELRFAKVGAMKNCPLRVAVNDKDGVLELSAQTPDGPGTSTSVPARVKGDKIDPIGWNPEFLARSVNALLPQRGGRVTLQLISPLRPALLVGANGRALLMPIRLNV